jgi:hypothetical protein
MKKIALVAFPIFVIVIAFSGCIDNSSDMQKQEMQKQEKQKQEMQKQEMIVKQVLPFQQKTKPQNNQNDLLLHGKALIWDMTTNTRSPAYDLLSEHLKANSSDKAITVFLITGAYNEIVGTYSQLGVGPSAYRKIAGTYSQSDYSQSRALAYRTHTNLSVVYWPENKTAGVYSIPSTEPPITRASTLNPEYGDPNKPIVEWIAWSSLKRG